MLGVSEFGTLSGTKLMINWIRSLSCAEKFDEKQNCDLSSEWSPNQKSFLVQRLTIPDLWAGAP